MITEKPVQLDRRSWLGGSDIAAILGVSPWETPYSLFLKKTAEFAEEPSPAKSKIFRRGKLLEPVIIELARQEYDLDIVARNQRFFDSEFPFMSAEIDFEWIDLDGSVANADAKSANPFTVHNWGKEEGEDDIPQYYAAQFLWGQAVTCRELTICVTLIGTDDLRIYRVRRDEELIQYMREKATDFWERVVTRTPPPLTTLEDIRLAYPKDMGSQIMATLEIEEMVQQVDLLKKAAAGDQARIDLLSFEIQKYMTTATELLDQNGKKIASFKTQKRKAYSVTEGESRVFRT